MDDGVPALLLRWGMKPAVIQNFIDQDVTIEDLQNLNSLNIKQLVPEEERPKFSKHFETFKNSKHAQSKRTINAGASTSGAEPPKKKQRKGRAALLGKRSPPAQLLSLSDDEPSVNHVHRILKSNREGHYVLAFYNQNGELDNSTRDELGKQLILAELKEDIDQRLSDKRYTQLSEWIVELFPSESCDTWYSAQKHRGCTIHSGRLWYKFYNLRRQFTKVGLISSTVLEEEIISDEDIDCVQEEEDNDAILWLFTHVNPWTEVLSKWEETEKQREKYMRRGIYAYSKQFPALELDHGWELLLLDSNLRYPDFKKRCDTHWPQFLSFIQSELQKVKDLNFPSTFQSNDERTISILEKLSLIFKARTVPKSPEAPKNTSLWKPSRLEVQHSFFLRVNEIANLKEIVKSRRNILCSFGHTLQPYVLVVGSPDNIRQSFVVLDDLRWPVSPPLKALDVCFKLFFVLKAQFPVESRHIWLFIQRCVYSHEASDDFKDCRGLKSFLAGHLKDYERFCEVPLI